MKLGSTEQSDVFNSSQNSARQAERVKTYCAELSHVSSSSFCLVCYGRSCWPNSGWLLS
jgi:hypothetical protein